MIIYIICFKTAHVQRNYIEISIEYRVSAHCPHQDDGGLSVLLVNPCQPSLLRYFDIGILVRVTWDHPNLSKESTSTPFLEVITSTSTGGLMRFMHVHIKFHQSHAMMNVFHILVQLIEIFCWVPPATQIATMIFDMIYVPSCLLAAAVLSGSVMF